jgi:subtilase family serine protease
MYQSLRLTRFWPLSAKAAPGPETCVSPSAPAHRTRKTMEHQFKPNGRAFSANIIGFGRFKNAVLAGLCSASLLLTARPLFAGVTTLELSPLIYKSTVVAPADGNKQIGVVLALPSSDPAGLKDFVKHVSTPGDPLFRQYLTPQQFAQKFGANEADYTDLKNWAGANGLVVSQQSAARTGLTVRGTVSQFQRLFKTQLNTYRTTDGQIFYSASVKPTVPAEIASRISGVIGLTVGKQLASQAKVAKVLGEEPQVRSDAMRTDAAGGTGPGGTYSCTDLRTIYGIPTWGVLEKGMVVAVFEQGYYHPTDVKKYFEKFDIGKNTKQTAVSVDQSPIDLAPAVEGEACLDIDMLVGMNPQIAEVKVFIDDYRYDPFPVAMVDAFQAIADDGTPQIISVSYGEDEGYFGSDAENAEDATLQQLSAEGITVFASSGDRGAFGDGANYYYNTPYNTADPCSDPYVTGVGGTSLFTGPHDSYENEITWNELPSYGATGGGISFFWSIPDYQGSTFEGQSFSFNGGSSTYRNVPDVAAVADPLTGVGIYVKDAGGWIQIGGTSLACPVWAGYVSTINAALNWSGLGNIGFFNPTLYGALSTDIGLGATNYLFDTQIGTNGDMSYPYGYPGFTAGIGADNCTGAGSIIGGVFAISVLASGNQPGTPPGPLTVEVPKVTSTSIKATWSAASGTKGYVAGLFLRFGGFPSPLVQAYLLPPDVNSLTFRNLTLTPDTQYVVQVFAYNASGETSNNVLVTTPNK